MLHLFDCRSYILAWFLVDEVKSYRSNTWHRDCRLHTHTHTNTHTHKQTQAHKHKHTNKHKHKNTSTKIQAHKTRECVGAHSPGCSCVRKWALRSRATPSKSPSFMAIFLIILILPAPSLCPGNVPLITIVKTTSVVGKLHNIRYYVNNDLCNA